MGLLDILRGERRPRRPDLDRLFAISTAEATLVVNLGLMPMGRAGVCFKPVQMGQFDELLRDMDQLLALGERSSGTRVRRTQDDLGFAWVLLEDDDLQDLVTNVHLVNRTIEERGFPEQLLCSVFGFDAPEGPVLLVYGYKRGSFYPFAPREGRTRDTALELRLQAALARELPMEPELERWFPVWGAPVLENGSAGA